MKLHSRTANDSTIHRDRSIWKLSQEMHVNPRKVFWKRCFESIILLADEVHCIISHEHEWYCRRWNIYREAHEFSRVFSNGNPKRKVARRVVLEEKETRGNSRNSIEKWSLKGTARRTRISMEESCCNPGRTRRCGCKSCRHSRKPSRTCRRDHRSTWRSPISRTRCERAAKIVSTLSI